MGMRAGLIYKSATSETYHLTTVQRATVLDKILGQVLSALNEDARDRYMNVLFFVITHKYEHIGAIADLNDPDENHPVMALPGETIVNGGLSYGTIPDLKVHYKSAREAMFAHLDHDSIGAYYNEGNPGILNFYYYKNTDGYGREDEELAVTPMNLHTLAMDYKNDAPGNLPGFTR